MRPTRFKRLGNAQVLISREHNDKLKFIQEAAMPRRIKKVSLVHAAIDLLFDKFRKEGIDI